MVNDNKRMELYDRLCSITGDDNITIDSAKLQEYSRDVSPFPAAMPGMVVTPTSTEIVSQIIKACNAAKTPVLPFGSAYSFTGLSNRKGSSTLVIDMRKMNRVIEIDEPTRTVRAEAGIIVGNLSDKVRERGYYLNTVAVPYYHDTLGGMISGVVGGGYPLYSSSVGLNNRHIFGLRVVLPTGSIVETNGRGINNASARHIRAFMRETNSPDMTGIFVGDGGMFGVKTEATMAMYPIPPFWESGAKLFTSFEDAYQALFEASSFSSRLQLCDYLTVLSPEITEIYSPNMNSISSKWSLVYYLHGFEENETRSRNSIAESIFCKHGGISGTDALLEFSEGMRTGESYWKTSVYAETLIRRASCAFFVGAPSFEDLFKELYSRLKERVKAANSSLSKTALTHSYVIHSVLQNCIWANIVLNYNSEETRSTANEIMRELYELAAEAGVTLEAHSGYAAKVMGACWSDEFKSMVMAIKGALDPNNVVNPGLWFGEV